MQVSNKGETIYNIHEGTTVNEMSNICVMEEITIQRHVPNTNLGQ